MLEQGYLIFARDIWSVYSRKLYTDWGYETYSDYLKQEVGISENSAYRARLIFETFTYKCGVRPVELNGIGRGRITMIRPIVDRQNVRGWIKDAKTLSWADFSDKVSNAKLLAKSKTKSKSKTPPSGSPAGSGSVKLASKTAEESQFKTRTFHLPEDSSALLDEALGEAQRITQSHSAGFNLSCIVQHFLAHRLTQEGKKDGRLYYHLRHMEKIFGGRLIHIKDDKAWEILAEAIEDPENSNHFGTSDKDIISEPYGNSGVDDSNDTDQQEGVDAQES